MAENEPQDKPKLLKDFRDMCLASEEMVCRLINSRSSSPSISWLRYLVAALTCHRQATQYLDAHNWDLVAACNSYFADEDDKADGLLPGSNPEEPYTGPRTLDGRPAPQVYRRSRNPAAAQPKRKGVATLGSLASGSHQHGDDDDDDDDFDADGDDDGRGNLFAGGEKSGLAVQDPNQEGGSRGIINDILAKAKA